MQAGPWGAGQPGGWCVVISSSYLLKVVLKLSSQVLHTEWLSVLGALGIEGRGKRAQLVMSVQVRGQGDDIASRQEKELEFSQSRNP